MTFFIAANVVTYHQTEMPSDADTDKLFHSLQQTMAKIPAFAAMSNADKQQIHASANTLVTPESPAGVNLIGLLRVCGVELGRFSSSLSKPQMAEMSGPFQVLWILSLD